MGSTQLDHPDAQPLRTAFRTSIDAPFPTTTTVSLASLATGLPPSQHGLIAYELYLPDIERVVNSIQWTTLWGDPIPYDYDGFLPSPNLWERLKAGGVEPITIQPGHFEGTPLSKVLYRGCRYEPVYSVVELIDAAVDLAARPGRLVEVYVPNIDVAAHTHGQSSQQYAQAMAFASGLWEAIRGGLPDGAVLVGTSDHGHVDIPIEGQAVVPKRAEKELTLYGDTRVMFVKGDGAPLADALPARWLALGEFSDWLGPGPHHPALAQRAPDGALLADDGHRLMHRFTNQRLIGSHGGLTDHERLVPLLVAG